MHSLFKSAPDCLRPADATTDRAICVACASGAAVVPQAPLGDRTVRRKWAGFHGERPSCQFMVLRGLRQLLHQRVACGGEGMAAKTMRSPPLSSAEVSFNGLSLCSRVRELPIFVSVRVSASKWPPRLSSGTSSRCP